MVTLGIRLRELSRHRIGVAVSFALACLAALTSVYSVSLLPPGLSAQPRGPAGAHTQILIDDRKVSVLTAGFDSTSFDDLHEGTQLAGSIMAQDPVRDYTAQQARIPVAQIQFSDPQYPVDPPLAQPATSYSLTVAARPSAPILDVYARAPTLAEAKALVDASAQGLRQYLAGPGSFGLEATQLGHGAEVNTATGGTMMQALESFLAVLVVGCVLTLLLDRWRRGWNAQSIRSGLRTKGLVRRPDPREVAP